MSSAIRVGILGASGYGAGELLRLFVQHRQVEVVWVTSTSIGEPIARLHPHLRGFYDLHVVAGPDMDQLLASEHAVIFSALPHGLSGAAIESVLREFADHPAASRLKILDFSGDFRLADETLHRQHYPESPPLPDCRRNFVYGLPELFADRVRTARFIANPGCLATAAILAAAPLITRAFTGTVAIDAKTGSSGSGRTLKETTHHPTRHADFRAYKPLAHQHEPEILQAWGDPHGNRIHLSFVAQSLPTARGIFVTAHATLPDESDTPTLRRVYESFYAGRPFVRVVDESPTLQDVVGSNFCDVAVTCRGRQVIAMAALDNLVKGMAGMAIQNMNLMCGLPETEGLWTPSFRPV
ncbi:MAG TPA: N-acetyl-gamma-glutamyl-phosphate reductase [Phycisphaerae bacterium]|jgi:N-acetyl-gamma-glutamyl-phosphate reductase